MQTENRITHLTARPLTFPGNEQDSSSSSYVLLNHRKAPGSMLFCGTVATKGGMAGQIAVKLSLEHFVNSILKSERTKDSRAVSDNNNEALLEKLEVAYREANRSLSSFANNLQAGDRLKASLLSLIIEDNVIAFGRAGLGSAYLLRAGRLFPFFDGENSSLSRDFLGSTSLIAVDLAAVPLLPNDTVILLSSDPDQGKLDKLSALGSLPIDEEAGTGSISELFEDTSFGLLARLGDRGIFLEMEAGADG